MVQDTHQLERLLLDQIVKQQLRKQIFQPTTQSDGDIRQSKDNVTYSTDFTESSLMTISCISGDDVSVVIPTTCNSDGTKTATVTTV